MAGIATTESSLERILETAERLSPKEKTILRNKMLSWEEEHLRRLAEQANRELNPHGRFPTTPSGFPIVQVTLEQVEKELKEYEARFGMSSEEFYERYLRGEMGDSDEVMRWARTYRGYLILSAGETEKESAHAVPER